MDGEQAHTVIYNDNTITTITSTKKICS